MVQLTPPLGRHQVPPFHEMTWQEFQLFSRELLSRDKGPGLCFEYGINGQSQHGIDLKKEYDGLNQIDVAQCKCWQSVKPADIRDAVTEFRKHAARWRAQRAARFILMIACDVADAKLQAMIRAQQKLLAKAKIKLQVWGARQLEDKLRPHQDIAQTYCSQEWAARICRSDAGLSLAGAGTATGVQAVVAQLGEVALDLSEARIKELDRLTVLSKQHRFADVLAGLRAMKTARSWISLSTAVRARVLRFESTTVINHTGDLDLAERLIAEGRGIHPEGDFQVADAYLAYRRKELTKALQILQAPKSLNALNLRVGLLLESGEVAGAIAAVSSLPEGWKPDADTHRYAAYGYLLQNKVEEARHRIDRAMETGNTHPPVRETLAVIRYFSAISPAYGIACRHLNWPIPVPWCFVKRDRQSLDGLVRAAEIFATLANEATTSAAERVRYERWRLACLGCHFGEQAAAADAVRQRLQKDATDVVAVVWALERGYEFNRAASEAALAARVRADGGIDECLALSSLRFMGEDFAGAEQVLDENRARFEQANQLTVWDAQRRMARQALESKDHAGLTKATMEELTTQFEAGGDAQTLFQLCEFKLRARAWDFVADHAEKLVIDIGTEPALRLALHGLFRAERYDRCLETLEKNRGLLPDGALSTDLATLRIECRRKLGHLSEALREARQGFAIEESFARMLQLFQVQLEAGDSFGAIETARKALALSDVPPAFCVEAAHLLGQFDKDVAISLWRRGMAAGIDRVGDVRIAYDAAMSLGLDRESAPLVERIMALAREGKGGVVALTLAQTRQHMRDASRAATDIWQTYSRGQIPAHLATAQTHLSLGRLYHGVLRQNQVNGQPHRSFPAFFRSASRSLKESTSLGRAKGQLHLDITALLFAQELGILDLVEQHFGPLQISPHVTGCLFKEVELAGRQQVSRYPLAQQLLRLLREKRLTAAAVPTEGTASSDVTALMGQEWSRRMAEAQARSGAIVDYLPLRSNTDDLLLVELNESDKARVWGMTDCARLLYLTGRLALNDYNAAVAHLPEHNPPKVDEQLRAVVGKPMHLLGNIWEALADATILAPLCEVCQVSIDKAEADGAGRLQDQVADNQDLVMALQSLLHRVNEGLKAGHYQLFAAAKPPPSYPGKKTPTELVLLDLIAAGDHRTGYAWADDRMLSRFRFCGALPIIGAWEVLQALRGRQALTNEEYFAKLDWLRRANVRYFPILEDEICFQLRGAPLDGTTLVETPALATLRRYAASCLLDRERLQPPQPGATSVRRLHDFTFLLELLRGIQEALTVIWRDSTVPVERQEAEANWLWNNLYFDVASFRQLLGVQGSDPDVAENTVLSLSALFVRSLMLKAPRNVEDSPKKRYLRWLHENVVQPFLQTNAPTRTALARAIGNHVRMVLGGRYDRTKLKDRRLMSIVLQRFVMDLPEDLVTDLGLTSQEWERIGITMHGPTVNIAPFSFDAIAFWTAAAKAINNGRSEVVPRDRASPIILTQHDDPSRPQAKPLNLVDPQNGQKYTVNDSLHPILVDNEADRAAFLGRQRHLFDGTAAQRAAEITRIAGLESPAERMFAAQEWRGRSMEVFYRGLAKQANEQGGFNIEALCPADWQNVVRHLRLGDPASALNLPQISSELLMDEGLAVAVERMSCLPISLDASLVTAFRSMAPEEARGLLEKWEIKLRSPVQLIHLLNLCGIFGLTDPSGITRAEAILTRLLSQDPGEHEFACFHGLLRIIRRSVNGPGSAVRSAPFLSLLVNWYHASRVFSILIPSPCNKSDLASFLAGAGQGWTADVLQRVPGYWEDVAHPQHLTRGNLLLHGLDAVFREWPAEISAKLNIPQRIGQELNSGSALARMLQLAFVGDWALYHNALGTFLSTGAMRAVVWNENVEPVISGDAAATHAAARRYVAEIIGGDSSQVAWVRLHALLGDAPIPPELHDDIKRLVEATQIMPLYQAGRKEVGFVLSVVARLARRLADDTLITKIEEQLFALAQVCATQEPVADGLMHQLLDTLLILSTRSADSTMTARTFFTGSQRLMQVWPEVATALKESTGGWVAQLPLDQQGALWPFIVHIRALAK